VTAACPRCGFLHEPDARFCGGYGQPILASGPVRFASPETYTPPHLAEKIRTSRGTFEGERKQVTVLFVDMKGSLELLADSGEVVVRAIDNDLHLDYSAVGQTTYLAAQMERLARPGSTLLAPETRRLTEGFLAVTGLGPVPIKGITEPVEVYELTGTGPARYRLQAGPCSTGASRSPGRWISPRGCPCCCALAGRPTS
jgi:class 3 adenylate cyclase